MVSGCRIVQECLGTASRVLRFVLTRMFPFSEFVTLGEGGGSR
jgi:hypothetical protein